MLLANNLLANNCPAWIATGVNSKGCPGGIVCSSIQSPIAYNHGTSTDCFSFVLILNPLSLFTSIPILSRFNSFVQASRPIANSTVLPQRSFLPWFLWFDLFYLLTKKKDEDDRWRENRVGNKLVNDVVKEIVHRHFHRQHLWHVDRFDIWNSTNEYTSEWIQSFETNYVHELEKKIFISIWTKEKRRDFLKPCSSLAQP